MDSNVRGLDELIGLFAPRQRGNVTRRQLLAHGASPTAIDRRLRIGALQWMYRGVYYAGYGPPPTLARECAAVLACGRGTLVSFRTAARLWTMPAPRDDEIEVTVVGRQVRGPSGLSVHLIGSLAPGELRRIQGISITSPALTALDLAGVLDEGELATALNEARVNRVVRTDELHATIQAHPKRRGARTLARLLALEVAELATASEAEALCLKLMREYEVMPDETQARVGGYRVDFLFRAERLIVEVDGYRYHGTRHRFVRDRRRTAALTSMGFVVYPVSWPDLVERPRATMVGLARALAARRPLPKTS